MEFPEELHYTKEHEWIRKEGEQVVVGITEFAQDELGDIVFIELPDIGKEVKASETLCVVESTKAASDVYAPVSGTVKEVNESLNDNPEQVNESPYQDGWLAKLEGVSGSELEGLMSASQYKEFVDSKG